MIKVNKKERIRAFELNEMATRIRPLSGESSRTITTLEVGKSWMLHEPLFSKLNIAIYANSDLSGEKLEKSSIEYYSEMYEKAVKEFYEYLGEIFPNERNERPILDL